MDQEKLNKARGKELNRRYKQINALTKKIINDCKKLIGLCCDLAPLYDDIKESNRLRMGWWVSNFAPTVPLKKVKVYRSIASRTKNLDFIESWQLRILGILTSVHHKDKPKSNKPTKRRVKNKSYIYHVGKAQDELQKVLRSVGGINALTESERESMKAQFGPLFEVVEKLNC